MNIIQVYQTNPFEEGQGGGVRYLKNLIFGINEKCEGILFFGIGEHHQKQNNIKLIPVTRKLTGYITFLVLLMIKLPFLNLTKYDVVHVHRLYFAIPFIIFKPKLKIVCSLHGRTFSVFESNHGSKMMNVVKFFFKIIERYCIRKIDYLVPVSQDVVNSFKEKYLDFDSYNERLTKKAKQRASELFARKKRPNFFHLLWKPLWELKVNFVFKIGFLDGKEGFVFAYLKAFEEFKTYLFLWLMYRNIE
jgi:glycosyltransferase involved in cell wall biosynthesis